MDGPAASMANCWGSGMMWPGGRGGNAFLARTGLKIACSIVAAFICTMSGCVGSSHINRGGNYDVRIISAFSAFFRIFRIISAFSA